MKRKRLILIITFTLLNVLFVLGFTIRKWVSTPGSAEILNVEILVSSGCLGEPTDMELKVNGELPDEYFVLWECDNFAADIEGGLKITHAFNVSGLHTITATLYFTDTPVAQATAQVVSEYCLNDVSENCCDGSFAPIRGKKYMISAWVREEGTNLQNFDNGYLTLAFGYVNPGDHAGEKIKILGPFHPKGNIIDGWQRIEEEFTVPGQFETISVRLNNKGNSDNVYFDDVRIYPFDGNMKSFVYDPETKRLVAEMDQNNYATVYEYNDEGEMVRVKKETERGMMTISESRNGTHKKNPAE